MNSKIINGKEFFLSDKTNKKLKVMVNGKWIHFGDSRYKQYFDKTRLLDKSTNHLDPERRIAYLKRATQIKDKHGHLTANDKTSPNYFAIHYLW
jgi:hypothetical protein